MAKGLDSCSDGSVRTSAGDEASCTIAEGLATSITVDAIKESCQEL